MLSLINVLYNEYAEGPLTVENRTVWAGRTMMANSNAINSIHWLGSLRRHWVHPDVYLTEVREINCGQWTDHTFISRGHKNWQTFSLALTTRCKGIHFILLLQLLNILVNKTYLSTSLLFCQSNTAIPPLLHPTATCFPSGHMLITFITLGEGEEKREKK